MDEFIKNTKEKFTDMFDGQNHHNNIVDHIEDSFIDKNLERRIDEELKKIDNE